MIERMKKITLLLHRHERDRVLSHLQRVGLVHLELDAETVAERVQRLRALRDRFAAVLKELDALHGRGAGGRGRVAAAELPWPGHLRSAVERMEYIEDRIFIRNSFRGALSELEQRRLALLPWGDFELGRLDELRARGVTFDFYVASERVFDSFDFGRATVVEVNREGDRVYFVAISYHSERRSLPFQEFELPRASLSEIENEIRIIRAHVETDEDELAAFVPASAELRSELERLTTQMHYAEAQHNLRGHHEESIYTIVGWFPMASERTFRTFLGESGVSYLIEEPSREDRVPIKLRNPPGAGLFEPITRIFSLPNYFELDPTLFFAPFFTVFFGLCLGDVGYGAILALLAGVLWFKLPREYRSLALLSGVLALSTIVSGVLLNTFFGKALFVVPGEEKALLQQGGEFALFASYTIQGRTTFPAMTLALLLGFVQVLFGIVLSGVNAWRQNGPLYVLKPLGMVLMLLGGAVVAVHADMLRLGFNAQFHVGPLAVGPALAQVPAVAGQALLVVGLVVFFLFCNPAVNIFVRPLLGLWDFYGFVTGLLGDFLSYIRLFALGLASGLLGNAFNQIAFMVLPQGQGGPQYASPMIVVSIVLLVLGHSLNLGLSILGSFVHPLRLTFVEFYKNIQFQGGGQEYTPFAVHKEAAEKQ